MAINSLVPSGRAPIITSKHSRSSSKRTLLRQRFKLLEIAQKRWRRLNGAELIPLVREGAQFVDGVRVERETNPEEERIAA